MITWFPFYKTILKFHYLWLNESDDLIEDCWFENFWYSTQKRYWSIVYDFHQIPVFWYWRYLVCFPFKGNLASWQALYERRVDSDKRHLLRSLGWTLFSSIVDSALYTSNFVISNLLSWDEGVGISCIDGSLKLLGLEKVE